MKTQRQFSCVLVILGSLLLSACFGGGGSSSSVSSNAAPVANTVSITDINMGDAVIGDNLTGNYTYSDAEGDAEGGSTFRWLRDGVAIGGATSSTYILVLDDVGTDITFEVTPIAATGTTVGAPATSSALNVINTPPTASSLDIDDLNGGFAFEGDTLSGSYTYSDAEGDAEGTSTFRWLRDGVAIGGATNSTYVLTSDDVETIVTFEVTPIAATGAVTGVAVVSGGISVKSNDSLSGITFNDIDLENCVSALGLTYIFEVTTLDCSTQTVTDLGGIEDLTSLTTLDLSDNAITDLSPLAGLTSLASLYLQNTTTTDITSLAALTALTELDLGNNSITDISSLSGLTLLTSLELGNNNNITDVSPLAGMTVLVYLDMADNDISDVSSLASLTALATLKLGNNRVNDVSSLSGLTALATLNLNSNDTDINTLSGLTGLVGLNLGNSNISDVTVLSGLRDLSILELEYNSITDVSPLAVLTDIFRLELHHNSIGGASVGNVDSLVTLTSAALVSLGDNLGISCSELSTLIVTLGSPPVDTDYDIGTTETDDVGVNCTNP